METEGASDLQDLIDTSFADDPISGTNQNYITSIIQNPYIDADLSKYIIALSDRLNEEAVSETGIQPTTLQKSLITLKTCLEYEKNKAGLEDAASYNKAAKILKASGKDEPRASGYPEKV